MTDDQVYANVSIIKPLKKHTNLACKAMLMVVILQGWLRYQE